MSRCCGMPCRTGIRLVVLVFSLMFSPQVFADGADLEFTVFGIDQQRGGIILAGLYSSDEAFPEAGGEMMGLEIPVDSSTLTARFADIPPGNYIIGLLHDEDGDFAMDFGFLGIPREGYGFSGPQVAPLFPPSFNTAAVHIGENEKGTVSITVKYL